MKNWGYGPSTIILDSYGQGRVCSVTILPLHDAAFLVKCNVMAKWCTLNVGREGGYELDTV